MPTEAERIHQAIMNMRANIPGYEHAYGAYERGHKSARHAAAKLAQEAIAQLEARNAKLREACEAILAAWDGPLLGDEYDAAIGVAEEKIRAALAGGG